MLKDNFKQKLLPWPQVPFNEKNVSPKSVKLLGLTFDTKLNFDIHMNNLYKVSRTKLKGLTRIRNKLSRPQAKKDFVLIVCSLSV